MPLPALLSQVLVAHTIELDNEFEHRFSAAGGGARITSLVMWSNFLRFVGDGIAVADLPAAAALPKARVFSTLGGMERWRYVRVGPGDAKRDGWGSARGLRPDCIVRPTPAGVTAAGLWPAVFLEVERRWRERLGADAVQGLEDSLRSVVEKARLRLPEYIPIVAGSDGMVAGLDPPEPEAGVVAPRHLAALLSQALLAYTLDFERESELALALEVNVVRVLDEHAPLVRDLPRASGVSKEAVAMALTCLTKTGHVSLTGTTAATKRARLTPKGREARGQAARVHRALERRWRKRFGADEVERLRSSLRRLLDQPEALSRGLEPYPEGWRASKPYLEHTQALVEDPSGALPHYPMVLHRGGWPDGS